MHLISFKSIIAFFLVSILVVLIYTQSPLYSSNQNQYFLHGMAQAGLGSLNEDWLANTNDPTPLFTQMVRWTFLIFRSPFWFYIFYAFLMGLYFWCLFGIVDNLFYIRDSKLKSILTGTFILIAHSAALRFTIGNTLGENWRFLLDGGVAGQRLLGTVLQPSAFGVLLLAAIYLFMSDRPMWASTMAALAASIHPTYLFSAALLIAGFMLQTWLEEKCFTKGFRIGILALAIITPILIYIFINFWGSEGMEKAQYILTEIRLPHHTMASQWLDITVYIKTFLVITALFALRRQKRIFIPLLVIFSGTVMLSTYQILTGSPFLALIFPWRPSALLVPIASSVLFAKMADWLTTTIIMTYEGKRIYLESFCYLILVILCAAGIFHMKTAFDSMQIAKQRDMLEWVRENSKDGDRFLIPVNLETFRTATLRPAYVDYFAIPYSNSDVIQWYHRVLAANKFFNSGSCDELYHLRHDGRLNHIVTERASNQPVCQNLKIVYQDDYYIIYRSIK